MRLTKYQPETTVRVVARNMETGKSKSTTIYDTDPETVIESLERWVAEEQAEHPTPTHS